MERENGWEGGIGWEWKSEGVVGVELGGGEVTLLINDRASSSIERWRARHYSSCAFPGRQFFHLSLLSLCTIQPALFIRSHTYKTFSFSLFLGEGKKVTISPTLSLTPPFFIINVNVLLNPYSAQTSKSILVEYTLLRSSISFIRVCIFWHIFMLACYTSNNASSVRKPYVCLH
jgi:hypothetical protein